MPSRYGIDQDIQGLLQARIELRQGLAAAAGISNAKGNGLARMALPVRHFPAPHRNGVACQARGTGHRTHATPAQDARFRRGPLAAHTLVHERRQRPILLPNPFDVDNILHMPIIVHVSIAAPWNLLKLFVRGALGFALGGPLENGAA